MKNILLFHYFGGAGGKFIANCLTYSGKVAFQNFKIAQEVLEKNDFFLLEQALLNLIPEKDQGRTWLDREQGCFQLFGDGINLVRTGAKGPLMFTPTDQLKNIWLPIMTHDITEFNNCLNYFSQDRVFTVLVHSTPGFIDLAIRRKWPEKHHCLDPDLYAVFLKNLEKIKFNFVFNNWNPLDSNEHYQITKLAEHLGINFNLNLAKNYINKYIKFHL